VPGEIIDLAAAAAAIGVSPAQLDVALAREGATLAGVATRHGVASETLVDALVADAARRLDQAVLAGGVTAIEVAERRSALADVVRDAVEADRSVRPAV
jgi:lambda repressor-like predicted transcriptional regulator